MSISHKPASEELKHQDAQGPEVGRDVVALVEDDFRGHVLRRPTERPRLPAQTNFFGETKINLLENNKISIQNMFHETMYLWITAKKSSFSRVWIYRQKFTNIVLILSHFHNWVNIA